MNGNNRAFPYFIFTCVLITNIATFINGIKHHETWQIVLGSFCLALMSIVSIHRIVKYRRGKQAR
ncbi:MAG: hypothetical protein ABIN13_13370 [Mucilaginibacter sp.]